MLKHKNLPLEEMPRPKEELTDKTHFSLNDGIFQNQQISKLVLV